MKSKAKESMRREILNLVGDYYNTYIKDDSSFKPGDRINYSGRVYDEKELVSLVDSSLDFWLTAGRFTERFEAEFSKYLGARYAHLVNSGSSANLIAVCALTAAELGERRIKPGDEVITVAASFPTTVAPILQVGAVPVFLDITVPQYNIDVSRLEEALSERTKAVFVAHTLGNPFDVGFIKCFCDEHSLWLIEDNCDALGSEYEMGEHACLTGTAGDISTYSFYPPHHITMGEGGCVVTDNPLLSKMILSYRDWGRECVCPPGHDNVCGHRFDGQFGKLPKGYDHKYVYSHFGYNLKMTDMQAAVGVEQLKKLPAFTEKRRRNWNRLHEGLEAASEKLILPEAAPSSTPSWFGFLLTVRPESGISRTELTSYLEDHNIQTRLLFGGNILSQPCFETLIEGKDYKVCGSLDNTDLVMNNSFWIGVYPGMTDEMTDYMISTIKEFLCR